METSIASHSRLPPSLKSSELYGPTVVTISDLNAIEKSDPLNAVNSSVYTQERKNASLETNMKSVLNYDGTTVSISEKYPADLERVFSPRLSNASSSEQNFLLDEVYVASDTFLIDNTSPSVVEVESYQPFIKQASFMKNTNGNIKTPLSDSRRTFALGIFGEEEKPLSLFPVERFPAPENPFLSKYFYSTPSHNLFDVNYRPSNEHRLGATFPGLSNSTVEVHMFKWVFAIPTFVR